MKTSEIVGYGLAAALVAAGVYAATRPAAAAGNGGSGSGGSGSGSGSGGSGGSGSGGNTVTTPVIGNASLAAGINGQNYSASLQASGGTAPYLWTGDSQLATLGLTITPGGFISGVLKQQGTYNLLVKVTDANNKSAQAYLSISINPANQIIPTGSSVPAITAFAPLVTTGRLNIVTSLNPNGNGQYLSFVPGLVGNSLTTIYPNSVVIITMNSTTDLLVSGNHFTCLAGQPTPVPVGSSVSFQVL